MASYTRQELEEVWRRSMDEGYTDPLESAADGRGFDVISAMASVLERVSESVDLTTQALYIKPHSTQTNPPASGGVKAQVDIEVVRDTTINADTLRIVTGTQVAVSQQTQDGETVIGPSFLTTEDVDIAGAGPFSVTAVAEREGFQGNVRSGVAGVFPRRGSAGVTIDTITPGTGSITIDTANNDQFISTMVGQFIRVTAGANVNQPPARITAFVSATEVTADIALWAAQTGGEASVVDIADLGITAIFQGLSLVNDVPVASGRSAELDMLAAERNLGRVANETDPVLRERVCTIGQDLVSPNAIVRQVSSLLTPLGVTFSFAEVGETSLPGFVFDNNAFDDPFAYRLGRVFVGANVFIGMLIVVDGTQLPSPPDATIGSILKILLAIKGGGVPVALAFEPAIP